MALVSLSDVKTYLGISVSTYDTLLNMFITQTSAEINSYLDRTIEETSYTGEILKYQYSELDGQNNPLLDVRELRPQLFTKNYPIKTTGLTLKNDGSAIDSDNYYVDYSQGVINMIEIVSDRDNKLTIDYTAGYATVPQEIQLIAFEGIKQAFANSGTVTQGSGNVESKKIGDFSVSYGTNQNYIEGMGMKRYLAENKITLDRYKRIII